MSQYPSMPLFVDAYLADTTHLSAEEHGVYLLLLMAMWRRNGWVPEDDKDLARMCCVSRYKWALIKRRLRPMLIFQDGEISQKRLLKLFNYDRNCERPFWKKNNKNIHEKNGSGSSKNKDLFDDSRARDQPNPLKEINKEKDLVPRRRTNDWDLPPTGPRGQTAFLKSFNRKDH
jgi:uncharacterized protein YdaU (DUF1376 family)